MELRGIGFKCPFTKFLNIRNLVKLYFVVLLGWSIILYTGRKINMRIDTSKYPTGDNAVHPKKVRRLKILSKVATITCIAMYVSYIPQIIANFSGSPVSPLQPLVATINGCLWTGYGWSKTYKDWPVIIANIPGVIFGLVTVITVYIH
jgi:uncharacterized protein with PQ loop repeat